MGLHPLRDRVASEEPGETHEAVNDLSKAFGDIAGAGDVKKHLSKARRSLKNKKPDVEKALKSYDKALEAYAEQKAWRAEAAGLAPDMKAFQTGIAQTLGARSQDGLTRDQALFLAACDAAHRDISLNF